MEISDKQVNWVKQENIKTVYEVHMEKLGTTMVGWLDKQ